MNGKTLHAALLLLAITAVGAEWRPLLDGELSNFEVFMGVPHETVEGLPEGTYRSGDVHRGTPMGLGNDPKRVFSVVEEGGAPVLRVSGEIYGGLTTKEAFANYHLRFGFRWGERKWEPRLDQKRDSGVLYHCYGEHGAFWQVWKSCLELQVQESDFGDFIPLSGPTADVRGRQSGKDWRFDAASSVSRRQSDYTHASAEPDRALGEWNKIDLYVVGDTGIHVVNGEVVMVVEAARDGDGKPLTKGQLQIQSEAAECYYRNLEIRGIEGFPEDLRKQAGLLAGTLPAASESLVFEEKDGLVAIEAEHFFRQRFADRRAWHLTTGERNPSIEPDGDPSHIAGASGGAYLEILPDTRRDHDDKLSVGENFSNEPGKMAVLSYKVHFNTPGTYWLWARVFSTTSEDNGLHFGIDGTWPETARRWQTVTRDRWHWASAQRTDEVHTGVPGILTLEVPEAGEHVIEVSMREDGAELDKILLVNRREYTPEGLGPDPTVRSGELPAAFDFVPVVGTENGKPVPREADGDGSIHVSGELKQWHKVTVTLDGPFADELDKTPNPFTDHSFQVRFRHESGSPDYLVPGYFAADGSAAGSSARSGVKWRAHLSPDRTGEWTYRIEFRSGDGAALEVGTVGDPLGPYHGKEGRFTIAASDKESPDFRARGRLAYVGRHHLQFQGDRSWFLKAGADAPETLLAYADFDGTRALKGKVPLKTWKPHLQDWKDGDPTWKDGKGKGLIGALNYLSSKGMNAFSFIPYNVDGDGSNVWPFVDPREKLHYDCSKLDQWGVVFDHATAKGLHLHFKLQETEIDDRRTGKGDDSGEVPSALDGGALGPERKLYLREMVARFGHALALNWNLGEENTQTPEEVAAMAEYLRSIDPYGHPVVLHTYPNQQEKVYRPFVGKGTLTGVSLQNGWDKVHQLTARWIEESAGAGRPWVVANDEQGSANTGVPPDPGYPGKTDAGHDIDDIRKSTLWGNLMAGGAGVEYYFGYQLAENDLLAEDWRSRDRSWDYARIALEFFEREKIPFHEMRCRSELVGNEKRDNSRYCLANDGEIYLVYLPNGGSAEVELPDIEFRISWFNPRTGDSGPVRPLEGRGIKAPDTDDWLAVIRR